MVCFNNDFLEDQYVCIHHVVDFFPSVVLSDQCFGCRLIKSTQHSDHIAEPITWPFRSIPQFNATRQKGECIGGDFLEYSFSQIGD